MKTKAIYFNKFLTLPLTCLIIAFVFLTQSVNVHAVSQDEPFPFLVTSHPEFASVISADNYADIISEFKTVFSLTDDQNFIILPSDLHTYTAHGNGSHVCITGYVVKNVYFDDLVLDGEGYNSRTYSFIYGSRASFILDTVTGKCVSKYNTTPSVSWTGSGSMSILGSVSTTSLSGHPLDFITPRYPIFVNQGIYLSGSPTESFLIMAQSQPIGNVPGISGLPPIDDIISNITGSYNSGANSNNAPSSTPPSYDSNSSLAENIEGWFNWLGDTIKFKIDNLGDQLSDWFNNISDNLKDALNKVIKNIHDGFDAIIDNFESLFKPFFDTILQYLKPIYDVFDWLKSHGLDENGDFDLGVLLSYLFVPGLEEVMNLIDDHDWLHLIGLTHWAWDFLEDFILELSNSQTVHVFHVPSCTYHGQEIGNFDIDFSWYIPYKVWGDTMISAFLIVFYIYWLITTFSSHARGVFIPHELTDNLKNSEIPY